MVYFVSTPIGNLKDITYRAVEVLQAADEIFCEDTRHTLKLLNSYGIKKPLFSCHKFNEREAAEKIAAAAQDGKNIAVVSDAGMPVVSDPGNIVCGILRERGIEYSVLPGPNAALSALVLSAMPAARFVFLGFLPEKPTERRELIEKYSAADATLLFHVAPQDLDRDIKSLYEGLGDRPACAVREITKIHEECIYFKLSEGLNCEKRGEFVLVVGGAEKTENPLNALPPAEHIKRYMDEGYDKKEAIKLAARDRGVAKSEMYKYSLEL